MAFRMRVNRDSFKRVRTRIEALQLSDADRSGPLLIELDRENTRQVRRAFASEGSTTGSGRWPRWSPKYAAWRESLAGRRRSIGRRMLVLTGTMRDKFISPSHGDHVAEWRGGFRYAFGVADDVAYIHMGSAGRSQMPYRSVIDKTEADRRGFAGVLLNFYRKRIRQVLR